MMRERAARAGLGILEAIWKLNDNSARPNVTARVGIDSDPVVVGAGAGNEAYVFGETQISPHGYRQRPSLERYSQPRPPIA